MKTMARKNHFARWVLQTAQYHFNCGAILNDAFKIQINVKDIDLCDLFLIALAILDCVDTEIDRAPRHIILLDELNGLAWVSSNDVTRWKLLGVRALDR